MIDKSQRGKDEIERLSQTPQIEICKNEKWKEKVFPKG